MSYVCVKALKVETTTIPVGTVIERVGNDSILGRAFVTFRYRFEHFAVEAEEFRKHFEEVKL